MSSQLGLLQWILRWWYPERSVGKLGCISTSLNVSAQFFFFLKALDSTSNYKAWENCNCKILQCVPEAKVWLNCWQTNQKVSSLNIELHRKRIKKMQRLHTEPTTELNLKIDSLSFCVQCTFWEQLNTAAKNKGEKRIAKILHVQNYCSRLWRSCLKWHIFQMCVFKQNLVIAYALIIFKLSLKLTFKSTSVKLSESCGYNHL